MVEIWVSNKIQGTKNRYVLVVKSRNPEKIYGLFDLLPYRCGIIKREDHYYLVSDISMEFKQLKNFLRRKGFRTNLVELIKFGKNIFPFLDFIKKKDAEIKYQASKGHAKLLFDEKGEVGNERIYFLLSEYASKLGE
jgi:hypothetical protein